MSSTKKTIFKHDATSFLKVTSMKNSTDYFDMDEQSELTDDRSTLIVGSFNVAGAVFLIPVDAPIPSEIAETELPTGSLYKRLAAIDSDESTSFKFVPVSGSELLALERVWRTLCVAKRVYVMMDLPAARYDVLFTQAVRQIGLEKIDWSRVSEAIAAKVISDQRTKDTTPWVNPMVEGVSIPIKKGRSPVSSTGRQFNLPTPESSDEDQA